MSTRWPLSPDRSQLAARTRCSLCHYLHEFYSQGADGDQLGGLVFPGSEDPDYWDFLSLVAAMTAQVSDCPDYPARPIRRLTTLHDAISFLFNATVLALTVNILSSLM
jgi:uncharacterized membrane protein